MFEEGTTYDQSIVWINGNFCLGSEARVSPFDHGLLYGNGVWDTAYAHNGYIFELDKHVNRLLESAKAINLKVPLTKEQIKDAIIETTRRNKLKYAYIKFIVTRGIGEPYITANCEKPTMIILARPPLRIARFNEEKGKKAIIVSIRGIPPACGIEPRIKTLNYLNRFLMISEGLRAGVDQVIALDINGFVSEGATQNIFTVRDEVLFTPPSFTCLEGITKETVVKMAEREGYEVVEKILTPYDLYTAYEVFTTATGTGISPIIEIDGRIIGQGKIGPITKKLMEKYWVMLDKGENGTKIF